MSFVFVFVFCIRICISEIQISRVAESEYCRLKEENASLKLEIMKISLEEKKYRDLQQEVAQLSAQLCKV